MPSFLSTFNRCAAIFNLKINFDKVVGSDSPHILNLYGACRPFMYPFHAFLVSTSSLKYLGVHILPTLSSLYPQNFKLLMSTLKYDLCKRKPLMLFWFGRLALVKVNVLPSLCYLFQAIPI